MDRPLTASDMSRYNEICVMLDFSNSPEWLKILKPFLINQRDKAISQLIGAEEMATVNFLQGQINMIDMVVGQVRYLTEEAARLRATVG